MNWEFHPEAELELVESALHYEEQVTGLGARLVDEVQHVIELVLESPEVGVRGRPRIS